MNLETLIQLAQIAGAPIAAYVAVKIGISEALLTAKQAKDTADKAHEHIDALMVRGQH